jgi:hypothetical protein
MRKRRKFLIGNFLQFFLSFLALVFFVKIKRVLGACLACILDQSLMKIFLLFFHWQYKYPDQSQGGLQAEIFAGISLQTLPNIDQYYTSYRLKGQYHEIFRLLFLFHPTISSPMRHAQETERVGAEEEREAG